MLQHRSLEERFWSKVHKTRSCWIWTGALSPDGHGEFFAYGKGISAHRFAWIRQYGLLLPGIIVCHQCANPACVRVSHLALGSNSDNGRDGIKRPYGQGKHLTTHLRTRYGRKSTVEDRFWDKVDTISNPNGCWLWMGFCDNSGHGHFAGIPARPMLTAHRFAWILLHGPLTPDIYVCHNCPGGDNPRCVNPDHMFLGTQADNMRDAARKHRIRSGANHPHVKLSEEDVREIRRLRGTITQRKLADRFHVSITQIANIQLLKSRHLIPAEHAVSKMSTHPAYATRHRLTPDNVVAIRKAATEGIRPGILAKQYGVEPCTISNILARRIWKNIL